MDWLHQQYNPFQMCNWYHIMGLLYRVTIAVNGGRFVVADSHEIWDFGTEITLQEYFKIGGKK
jgi:hypothetical protein